MTLVKICGLTLADDAAAAVEAGADLLGIILWAPSPRSVDLEGALAVRGAAGDVPVVGVFVDEQPEIVAELAERIGLAYVQLHGRESSEVVASFGERAIKGVRDGDVSRVPDGVPVVFDGAMGARPTHETLGLHWLAARVVARTRPLLLSGALDETTVGEAVRVARPWGVDSARGTELSPGVKDQERVRRFVAAAKAGDA